MNTVNNSFFLQCMLSIWDPVFLLTIILLDYHLVVRHQNLVGLNIIVLYFLHLFLNVADDKFH